MPISIYREWLATPEFHDLPDERRSRILSNYFDENLANDEFAKLEPDRQKRIKSNFLKEHEDFFKDINYKAASIYDRVAKTVDDGDKEVPASPGGVMLMPDGQRLKWTGEDFESDTGKRVSIYEAALDSYDQQEKQRAARPESEKHGALETLGRGLVRGTYQAGAATADWGGIIADRAKRDWVNLSEYGKAQKQASRAMDVGLDEIAGKTREIPEVDFKQVGPTALAEKLHGKSQEWRDIARYGLAKDEDIQGAILDNPALLADLRWWADGLGEMAPSLAATIIPGAGAGKAIQVLGKGAKLTPAVVSRLVRFGSAISGGAAGGMFEGGSTYNELIEKGATEEQASRAATNMALASSVLNALSVDKLLGKSRPGLRNKLAKFMRDGTWESSTEIAEEPVEAVIKWSEGYANKDEILEQLWNAPNIAPIAFVMGAGGSIVAGETTNSNQTQTPPGAPTAPASPAPGMEKATDADLQQSFGRAREALGQDQDNPEKRKAFIDIKREVERRQQAPAQPDALRNQANDLRLQLVKEPDEQKRAGILDQLTRVEQQLQESGVQRTDIGTPLQTSETVKPDTRPSATSELDALRQESERLNTELEDSHKRTRGLQEKISGTANDHTKRMILIEQLAAEVQEYKSKLDRQSGIERRAGELRAAAARQLLPAPPESALQSAVDPNLITPTRGSMAESQVEAGMVENPLERGGVEASTARARQQRTVSQPSAVAPEAVDMATDYGVRTESEAKINSMPRKELNALAKSLKMDFKGKIDELRKRLIKRGVDPALLGIDRVAIRQKVESALSQRADSIQRQNPPENPPEPPVPPAPTTPKGPAPTGPAPQGTSPSVPVTTKPEPSTPSQSSEKPPVSSAPETTVEDIADLNVRDEQTGLTRAEAESLYDEEQELARKLPNNVGKARMEGKLSKRQLDIVDRLDEIERLLPNTSKQYREIAKESRAKTTAEYEAKRYAYAEEQRQKLLQKNGLEVGDQVETIVPGMLGAARYRGVVKQRKNGSVYVLSRGEAYDAFRVAWLKVQGEGTVSREAGPKQSEPKQRKPRSTKPEQPAHEIPFVTWAQKTMNRLAGKRNATLQLPSVQDVKGSHEFWTGADVLDERVRNEANYRNMTKGEKYVSKKKMREFTGFTEFNTSYNGDVTIEQLYNEFRAAFPGFFPNAESDANYGTDYESQARKAFMDIVKAKATTILDAAKQNRVTILDESMLADGLLEKHQSEEEAEFEAWLDEHPEERKRIADEEARRSEDNQISPDEEIRQASIDKALETLQREGHQADAIARDTVEILVDSGYTTDEILESFSRDQEEDVDFNPDEFKDAFESAIESFYSDKENKPQPQKPANDQLFEPPDVKGNQQGTFLKDIEDRQPGLFSATRAASPERILQEAKDALGTTDKLTEAGFVLPDGTLVKVPQRGGKKSWYTQGHQWIASEIPSLKSRPSPLSDFMAAGAIRIDYQPSGGSTIEIRGIPTAKQKAVLTRMIEGSKGAIPVDMIRTLDDGSLDMYSGWYTDSKTLASDAKSFAAGRLKMTGSLTQQFHQSDGTHWSGRSNQVQGMKVKSVAKAVAPLGYDLEVVQSIDDLPSGMRAKAAKFSQDGFNVEGGYDPATGKIYLISDNLPSAKRAVEVALHEAVGHRGLRAALGGKLDGYMESIASSEKYGDAVASLGEDLGMERLESAEEWFAREVESGQIDKTLWSKFVGAFRNALRSMGIKLDFSEQDLKRLVRQAHKSARRQGNSRGGDARFSATKNPETEYERLYNGLLEGGATPDEAARWVAEMGVTKDTTTSKPAEKTEQPTGFTLPEETGWQKFRRYLQDKLNRLEQAQNLLGGLSEDKDAYMWAELFPGKAGDTIQRFDKQVIRPILERLSKTKLTVDDLGLYLYAQHARERNEHIRNKWADIEKVPKKYRETIEQILEEGSGMSDAEAQAVLDLYQNNRVIQDAARTVNNYLRQNLDRRLAAGLLSEDQYHVLHDMFEHYVPLKTAKDGETSMRTGKGFSVSGPEILQAWGRTTKAANPFIQSTLDTAEAIIRSEKNIVDESLAKLIEANPNGDLWEVHEQVYVPHYTENGDFIETRPKYEITENTVEFKRDGKPMVMILKDNALAKGYKNMGAEQINRIVAGLVKFNSFLRNTITIWSPDFIFRNFTRDIQTALVHIAGEKSPVIAGRVAKDVRKAMRGVWRSTRGKTPDYWSKLYDEMSGMGGVTGWFDYDTFEQKARKLENELKHFNEGNAKHTARKILRSVVGLVEDANQSVENAVRLSTYKQLLDAGYSKAKAAQYAKNVTVNFNKKGLASNTTNALFLFSNAGIQGGFRVAASLLKNKRTRQIAAGITAFSFLMNVINRMNDDDDEYNKFSDYNRDNHFMFMIPGTGKTLALSLATAYGYNVFHTLGNVTADVLYGDATFKDSVSRMVSAIDKGFNPLGAGSPWQLISPTILDPWVQIAENKTFAGTPLYAEQPPYQPKVPNSQLYFKSARQETVRLTGLINRLTGGSETVSGYIDINPEIIDHLWDSYTGGAGKFVANTMDSLESFSKMDMPEIGNIPIVHTMVKGPSASFARSRAMDTLSESGRTIFGEIDTQRFRDDLKYAFQEKIITAEQYSNYLRRFTANQAKAKASLGGNKSERKQERPASPERTERRDRTERPTRKIGLGTRPPVTIGSFA